MKLQKKVFCLTNGCPENRIDLARMKNLLTNNGWEGTAEPEEADVILFNACGLTKYTENLSVNIIEELRSRKKESAKLLVCGCLPKINKELLETVYQGETFGSDDIQKCADTFGIADVPQNCHANKLYACTYDPKISKRHLPNLKKLASLSSIEERLVIGHYHQLSEAINVFHPYSFCIKISTGCANACSFCAVRISRGKVNSKPIEAIVDEFEEGLAQGYTEFSLIGTDLGSYGRDRRTNLVALLRALIVKQGEYQIRLRNIQPRFLLEMLPELRQIFQSGKIPYLSSAAESGNNRILKRMNRGYCIEDYKKAIRTIYEEFPEMQIRTQLMAGFPGETDEEFQDTLRLLDDVRFDLAETFMFEARPGTKAAELQAKDPVPLPVAKKRAHRLFMKSVFNQWERKREALKRYKEKLRSSDDRPRVSAAQAVLYDDESNAELLAG